MVCDLAGPREVFLKGADPAPAGHGRGPDDAWVAANPCYKHLGLYAYKAALLEDFAGLPVGKLEPIERLEQLRVIENGREIAVGLTDEPSDRRRHRRGRREVRGPAGPGGRPGPSPAPRPVNRVTPSRAQSSLVLLLAFVAGVGGIPAHGRRGLPLGGGPERGISHYYEYLTEGLLLGPHLALAQAGGRSPGPRRPLQAGPARVAEAPRREPVSGQILHLLRAGPRRPPHAALAYSLTGRELPQRLAVAAFGSLGLGALALLISSVRRRHFPAAPGLAVAGAFACAAFASWLPVVIRRPFFWELPIVAAVACLWWALYLLWRFHDSGGRVGGWAIAAGVALAFMIGSRVTCVLAAAAILLLLLPPGAAAPGAGRRLRTVLLASSIVLCAGLGLLAYNHARFGRWLEFGQSYQLWGDEYRNMTYVSPRYAPFNAYMYLLAIARPSPYFPFVRPALPVDGPDGYLGIDEVYGALFAAPVQLAGLLAIAWLLPRRRDPAVRPLLLTVAAAAAASLLAAAVLLMWGRLLALRGGALGGLDGRDGRGNPGGVRDRWTAPAGRARHRSIALGTWTAAFVLLASADYSGIARATRPGAYAALARVLDYPSLWWARARGIGYGPLDLAVRIPDVPATGAVALLESGRRDHLSQLLLVRETPGEARLELVEDGSRLVLATAPFPSPGGVVRAHVAAPWL